MHLQAFRREHLPVACRSLPDGAQQLLTTLVQFARGEAIRRRTPQVAYLTFHAPQWLIADTLGVHEETVRRWLKRPEVRRVVRATAYREPGDHHMVVTGKLWCVALYPSEHTTPRIEFDRENPPRYRDVSVEADLHRVRGSYPIKGKGLFQALADWVLSSTPVVQEETGEASVYDSRNPVEKVIDAVLHAKNKPRRREVTAAGQELVRYLRDSPDYLPAWCKVIWRLVNGPEHAWYWLIDRLTAMRHDDPRLAKPGAVLLRELKVAGLR